MSDINIVLENRDDIHVAVEEKDINVEVPAGKDGRSLRPRGEWSASAAYAYLDLVGYQGSSYAATKAVPAGTLPTDTTYWMLSAEKGEPGGSVWGLITGDLSDQTDLQTALDAKAPVILSSASGSIASFSDGSPAPVTALSVGIEPVQTGTGDPSPENVRPISGHTSATVTRTGKNLLDASTLHMFGSSSKYIASSQDYGSRGAILVKPSTVYTFSCITADSGKDGKIYAFNSSGTRTQLSGSWNRYSTFTTPSDCVGISFYCRVNDIQAPSDAHPMLELGSTASAYEPYQAQQVTIDLDGTRYGGSLNVLTGEMVVDRGFWTTDGSGQGYSFIETGRINYDNANLLYKKNGSIPEISSEYKRLPQTASNSDFKNLDGYANGVFDFSNTNQQNTYTIRIRDDRFIDLATALGILAVEKPTFCYELATPLTVQLSPSTMKTLLGQNHLWSDTGNTSVTYRADTKLYIDGVASATAKVTRQMIADSATADGKAPKSLATGDLIIVGDELRKATTNIGNGSAITASNSTTATLADVIKALQ